MKNRILAIIYLFVATTMSIFAQSNLKISGKIVGIDSGELILCTQETETRFDTVSTAKFEGGLFSIEGTIKEPKLAIISVKGYQGGFSVIVEPGSTYEALLTNDNTAYIKGGKLQDRWLELLEQIKNRGILIKQYRDKYDEYKKQNKFRSASATNDTLKILEKEYFDSLIKFTEDNKENILSAYLSWNSIATKEMSLNDIKAEYEKLGEGGKGSVIGRMIASRIEKLSSISEGSIAPDFTLQNIKGEEMKFSDIKGEYKILDFWASWCGPCRLNKPFLKKLYEELHSKGLEIVSVSLDDKKQNWVDIVEKDHLNWIHLSSLKGWSCEVARQYSVKSLPSMFILDKNNKIISVGLKGEKLYKFVKDLFESQK